MNEDLRENIDRLAAQLDTVLAGKSHVVHQVLIALLCKGHVLIEDLPGMGKTTLAQGLAASLNTDYGRIQFTADLLPADIIGVDIFDPLEKTFQFHPGQIFNHIVLADEINRATPKAQSALLEAMAEGQVSIERGTRALPSPFFVIATQNPHEHLGTFPLPESQLDRFFMRISIGYPDREAERRVLLEEAGRAQLSALSQISTLETLAAAQLEVAAIKVADVLMDYVLDLLQASRGGEILKQGISPRAGKDLLAAAKAHAWLGGANYVTAADVQAVWLAVLAHRVVTGADGGRGGSSRGHSAAALQAILEQVAVPA